MEDQVTVAAFIQAKPGKEGEVKKLLEALVWPTLREEGCIQYDLHQSAQDACKFLFCENWQDKQALDKHRQSDHILAFREQAQPLLVGPVDVTLWSRISDLK